MEEVWTEHFELIACPYPTGHAHSDQETEAEILSCARRWNVMKQHSAFTVIGICLTNVVPVPLFIKDGSSPFLLMQSIKTGIKALNTRLDSWFRS